MARAPRGRAYLAPQLAATKIRMSLLHRAARRK
ncbi:hypothetical protein AZE42_07217 [Rhizopogon vesiculosus]|uniref:Uncharacterized protein n=1 Tax=Rhizopogon vesiculosus TaxID=180088 RepID=A0A1J8QK28_9AGAM|nr:hypothetical protein AZE42_07217 [Rhizopogon vesiculosus]